MAPLDQAGPSSYYSLEFIALNFLYTTHFFCKAEYKSNILQNDPNIGSLRYLASYGVMEHI